MFAVLHCLCVFHSLLTTCCFDETLQRYNDRLSDWSSFFVCLFFVLVYFLSASGGEKKWQSVKSSGCSLSLSRVVGTGSYSISMLTVCCILLKHMLWVWFCRDSEKRNRENKKNLTKKKKKQKQITKEHIKITGAVGARCVNCLGGSEVGGYISRHALLPFLKD